MLPPFDGVILETFGISHTSILSTIFWFLASEISKYTTRDVRKRRGLDDLYFNAVVFYSIWVCIKQNHLVFNQRKSPKTYTVHDDEKSKIWQPFYEKLCETYGNFLYQSYDVILTWRSIPELRMFWLSRCNSNVFYVNTWISTISYNSNIKGELTPSLNHQPIRFGARGFHMSWVTQNWHKSNTFEKHNDGNRKGLYLNNARSKQTEPKKKDKTNP